jgi:hypothetical protein
MGQSSTVINWRRFSDLWSPEESTPAHPSLSSEEIVVDGTDVVVESSKGAHR